MPNLYDHGDLYDISRHWDFLWLSPPPSPSGRGLG